MKRLETLSPSTTGLLILSFLCSMFWLASCGGRDKIHVGVSQCSSDDWRSKMNQEMLVELYQHPDVKLEILSAEDDNDRQIADIDRFIRDKVDVLVVSPREAAAVTPAIARARKAGIKVLVFDRKTQGKEYDAFIGADNRELGRQAAVYLKSRLASDNSGKTLKVLEIRGLDDSSPARERGAGFHEVADTEPNIEVVASVQGAWVPWEAARATDSVMKLYPGINAVFGHNDRMAIAAADMLRKNGRDDLLAVGIDGAPAIGLKAVEEGKLDATLVYPTVGETVLCQALDMARSQDTEGETQITEHQLVDGSNVDIALQNAAALRANIQSIERLNTRLRSVNDNTSLMRSALVATAGVLIMLAVVMFLVLRLYWSKKRSQELLSQRNQTLRVQRDELEHLNMQLKEATSSKVNFFTNVSHDLRTPLTLIATPLDTVRRDGSLPQRDRKMLDIAAKNVRILNRLINQILDFQKYESGKMQLHEEEMDISACFGEWTAAFLPAARKKDIRLDYTCTPEGAHMMAFDPEKMERVVFNLLSNAMRFTPANGTIAVHLDCSSPERIRFTVTDSGKGISSEEASHLFERFFQGGEKGVGAGSGIGLVVVKSFVELHGGTITVDSEPGKGATFTVALPIHHIQNAPNSPATSSLIAPEDVSTEVAPVEIETPPTEEGTPTLLVVEDNDDMRHMVKALLSSEYHVLTAPNGEAGIRLANKYLPDCIISDVMMPGIDGLELTRRLKGETLTSHIPVLLLTACAMDGQRADGYRAGADGYLAKPFNEDVLLARVHSLIEGRKLLQIPDGTTGREDTLTAPSAKHSGQPKARASSSKPGSSHLDPFSELDSEFYRKFVAMVEANYTDPDLSVEEMASLMGMSRVQFYRKLKALTNYSPVDLLRIFRLRAARRRLMTSECTVSEAAYESGFSSPSYFAKCFKEYFHELPSELQGRTSKIS